MEETIVKRQPGVKECDDPDSWPARREMTVTRLQSHLPNISTVIR